MGDQPVININVAFPPEAMELLRQLDWKLSSIHRSVHRIEQRQELELTDLSDLAAAVEQTNTAELAAETLIQGIADQLEQNQTDPAQVAALANQLRTGATALSQAVVANTPAADTPPPADGSGDGPPADGTGDGSASPADGGAEGGGTQDDGSGQVDPGAGDGTTSTGDSGEVVPGESATGDGSAPADGAPTV